MGINFLCPTHREWAYFHAEEALTYMEDAQRQGELFMQKQEWQEAMSYLGCAFETTEILMELQGPEKSFLLSRLTSLAILLANCFGEMQANTYADLILKQAKQLLESASTHSLGNKPRLAFIQECLLAIKMQQKQYTVKHDVEQAKQSAQLH